MAIALTGSSGTFRSGTCMSGGKAPLFEKTAQNRYKMTLAIVHWRALSPISLPKGRKHAQTR
jgi:hypothetical protein